MGKNKTFKQNKDRGSGLKGSVRRGGTMPKASFTLMPQGRDSTPTIYDKYDQSSIGRKLKAGSAKKRKPAKKKRKKKR